MQMRWLVVAAVGCSSSGNGDVVGPFTGDVHRYVVDRILVPQTSDDVTRLADDLDGDGEPDNQVGLVNSTLVVLTDATTHAADMVAAGALVSVVEIQADDLEADAKVGVRFRGAETDDASQAGGAIVDGGFASNRSRTTHVPADAIARLPIFENADPLILPMHGVEIDLSPDGSGGFDGIVRGAVLLDDARAAAFVGLVQMCLADPVKHALFERGLDTDFDGQITRAEFDADALIASFIAADVQMFDGDRYAPTPHGVPDSLSVGFGVHLVPCDSGRCSTAVPADTCHDRRRDGDETDVDCGGSCAPCIADAACRVPADCQSMRCDGGQCAAPACDDGVRDGFESDVDCGANCSGCDVGKGCVVPRDCTSGKCSATAGQAGVCLAP
jgi:hypothetical protein